jgi:Tfp pilus assembly protein PilX
MKTFLHHACGPAARRIRHRAIRALKEERGIALVMALMMTVVIGIAGTSVTYYATSNSTEAGTSKAKASARDLAEAGINYAVNYLYGQLDSIGAVKIGGVDPRDPTALPATTLQFAAVNGSVTYSGVLNTTTYIWTITSTGYVTSGGLTQHATLTRSLNVNGLNNGADGNSWSRFYQDSASTCLTIDNMTFVTNVATRGDLCIRDLGGITGSNVTVDVGGNVTITGTAAASGPRSPSAGTGWTSATNVYSSNGAYATNAIGAGATGANQDTTGFGFAIPANATIQGISVVVERSASACCNAVQTISESGAPTGGTFTIKGTPPGGTLKTSVAIAYNATAATVQSALVTMYGTGNVTCSGGPLPGNVACTFQGSYASMPVSMLAMNTKSLTGGTSPTPVFTNTTTGSAGALQDNNVQLLKAGAAIGNNKASATTWSTSDTNAPYGASNDMWGTTWTPAEINASTFGLRFSAKNVAAATSTASIDYISITVSYNAYINGVGTSSVSVASANIGGTCTYNLQAAHTPCTSTDHVFAGAIATVAPASNPALSMPTVDFTYWWKNAKPGPKHFCTNASPNLPTNFFDNDAGTTSAPNRSITINGEMAPATKDYDCQYWENGVMVGQLKWTRATHRLDIKGTIFVDGNFRFDEDGQIIHYFGRASIMSSADDEIDALVCAGGTGNTYATSCLADMTNWDPNTNMMVLLSQRPNEYDQGGTTCTGSAPNCYGGHVPAGFQGVMYSEADCQIHQEFQDSGPVICNTISLPDEGLNPAFYTFPFNGNLTDGQKYADVVTATHLELVPGPQSG